MGNSAFYWQPTGSTVLQKIDCGRTWSDMQITPIRMGADTAPGWGAPIRTDLGGMREVRISQERIANNAALIRQYEGMIQHLRAGGHVAAVLDDTKAWAVWSRGAVSAGSTAFGTTPPVNAFAALGTASMASGDEVLIESPNPEYLWDVSRYSAQAGGRLTLSDAVQTGFQLSPVFVRYRWFFPALRLAADSASDSSLLTHDRLLNWTLALPLEEHPGDIAALQGQALSLASTTAAGLSLDAAIALSYDGNQSVRSAARQARQSRRRG